MWWMGGCWRNGSVIASELKKKNVQAWYILFIFSSSSSSSEVSGFNFGWANDK